MNNDTIVTTTETANKDEVCCVCFSIARSGSRIYRRSDGQIYGSVKCLRSHAIRVAVENEWSREEPGK